MKKEKKKSFSCFLDDCYRFENPWEKCKRYGFVQTMVLEFVGLKYCLLATWDNILCCIEKTMDCKKGKR